MCMQALVNLPRASTSEIDALLTAIKSLHGLGLKVIRVGSHAQVPTIEIEPTRRLKNAEVFSRGMNSIGRFQRWVAKINDVRVVYKEQL